MNVVRGYVPAVFVYHPDRRSPDRVKWLPSFQAERIMRNRSYKWGKGEIESIGREFSALPKLDKAAVMELLKKRGWSARGEARVIGCTGDKRITRKYDGIKNRVALEVELSS